MSASIHSASSDQEKYSRMLFTAHDRTVSEGNDLLECLEAARDPLISMYQGKEINLPAPNGDLINGVHFQGGQKNAIVFLQGNGCFYESSSTRPLHWMESLKDGSGQAPHLIVFNPRGTGKSSGVTETHNVEEDLTLLFDYLVKEQGVDPKHVVFAGHSMGGYFAVFGALRVQKEYPDSTVHLVLDRSFPDLHSRLASKIEKYASNKISGLYLARKFHQKIDSWKWAKDSIEAIDQLKGRVCVIFHQKDGIVLYKDSFHSQLNSSASKKEYSSIELVEANADVPIHAKFHNREYTEAENEQIVKELKLMLGVS